MLISSMKATALLGSLVMLSLPLAKEGVTQSHPKPIKVTGCLQKGDEANEFVITDKAGKKYELTSDSVSLAGHVGHTVTVKGTAMAEEKGESEAKEEKSEKAEKAEAAEAKEHEGGHLQVSSLTMVSPKCK